MDPTPGCQIFLYLIYQNTGKYTKLPLNYQMPIKYTKWPYYIPNDHRTNQRFSFQGPPKYTQICIFGLKTNHLATLNSNIARCKSRSLTQCTLRLGQSLPRPGANRAIVSYNNVTGSTERF
jgi:hypothetical protein